MQIFWYNLRIHSNPLDEICKSKIIPYNLLSNQAYSSYWLSVTSTAPLNEDFAGC